MKQAADVTDLLVRWNAGDQAALELLMPVVYGELRQVARRHLRRESSNHTLQTTALVHEVYLRLVDQSRVKWQNRSHFFGLAAQMMRRILVDHARSQLALKRGGRQQHVTVDIVDWSVERDGDLVALDDALTNLVRVDPQKSQIVELRFFGGLSIDEIAEHLSLSSRTIAREWRLAKAWLYDEIRGRSQ